MNLWHKIDGYKSYMAAVALALYAIFYVGFYEGNWSEVPKSLMEAAVLAGIRSAIAKGF